MVTRTRILACLLALGGVGASAGWAVEDAASGPAAVTPSPGLSGPSTTGASGPAAALTTATPTPSVGPSTTPNPVSGLKPAIRGLLYLQGTPPASLRGSLAGYDVQGRGDYGGVSWAELQASPGAPITPDNPIDKAITDVRAWNAAHPQQPEVLKLRIETGIHSPQWAMNLGGPCVEIQDPNFGVGGCTPRFWTQAYASAFYQFESELAAKYDSVPEIAEVIISRDMTVYNEPLLRQIEDPTSVANLIAAGYSTAVDEADQMADIAALGKYWKHTRVGFTFNPYQTIDPTRTDEAFTEQLMAYGRQVLGAQLVLENDSLRTSFLSGGGDYPQMYAAMSQLGAPIGFQTAVLSKVGNLTATIQAAQQLQASQVELPPGFQTQLSQAALRTLAAGMPGCP